MSDEAILKVKLRARYFEVTPKERGFQILGGE